MSESTDKLEAQISEINDGLEAAIKGMHRATIRNEFADKVEAQIEDVYRARARVAVARAKLDALDAAEANAAPTVSAAMGFGGGLVMAAIVIIAIAIFGIAYDAIFGICSNR